MHWPFIINHIYNFEYSTVWSKNECMCQMVKNVQEMKKGIAWVLGQLFKQQGGAWLRVWRESYFNSRDGNENFFLLISCSRQEREFHLSISGFETRTRIEIETILARIFGNSIYCLFIDSYFQKKAVNFSKFLKIICLFFLKKF